MWVPFAGQSFLDDLLQSTIDYMPITKQALSLCTSRSRYQSFLDDSLHSTIAGVPITKGALSECTSRSQYQSFLDDSLHSTIAGVPITKSALSECASRSWESEGGLSKGNAVRLQLEKLKCDGAITEVRRELPNSFPSHPKLAESHTKFRMATLRVPNAHGHPAGMPELGGPIYSTLGGNFTDLYFRQLKDDCPDTEKCPWWKDEKEEDEEAASSNTELFGFVPKWMAASAADLNHGYLTPLDYSRPRQVMVHYHYLAFARAPWKVTASKVYDSFDWKLSKALHAKDDTHKKLAPGPYISGTIPKRVIAMSPHVMLSSTRDRREFKQITAGLVQLAILSNRTVVYPDVPCKTAWMHKDGDVGACDPASQKLIKVQAEDMPYGARIEPWDNANLDKEYRIANAFLADHGCMGPSEFISGMLNVEFEEWINNDAHEEYRCMGPSESISGMLNVEFEEWINFNAREEYSVVWNEGMLNVEFEGWFNYDAHEEYSESIFCMLNVEFEEWINFDAHEEYSESISGMLNIEFEERINFDAHEEYRSGPSQANTLFSIVESASGVTKPDNLAEAIALIKADENEDEDEDEDEDEGVRMRMMMRMKLLIWYWRSGTGDLVLEICFQLLIWYWRSGTGDLVLEICFQLLIWYRRSGTGDLLTAFDLVLEIWYWRSGTGDLLPAFDLILIWYWRSGTGDLLPAFDLVLEIWFWRFGTGDLLPAFDLVLEICFQLLIWYWRSGTGDLLPAFDLVVSELAKFESQEILFLNHPVVVDMNAADVVSELAKFEKQEVLFLNHPVVVNMNAADVERGQSLYGDWALKFDKVLKECRGLHYTDYEIDAKGAAKVSQYVFGREASITATGVLLIKSDSTPAQGDRTSLGSSSSSTGASGAAVVVPSNAKAAVGAPSSAKGAEGMSCEQSGMCSLGVSKLFYGNIRSSNGFKEALEAVRCKKEIVLVATAGEGFKEALEAVSYKKEIILVTTAGAYFVEFIFQLQSQWTRLGMDHMLILTMEETTCKLLTTMSKELTLPNISCAWDDAPMHKRAWSTGPHLWHLRWRFLARAIRLGYNVLSMDSDFMVLQDPYIFLKAPPFNSCQLLVAPILQLPATGR
eukprot:gene7560-712_t